jgi:hypothetical protein
LALARVNSTVMFLRLLFVLTAIVPGQFRDPGDCLCETLGSKKADFDYAQQRAKSIFVGRVVKVRDVIAHGGFSEKRVTLKVERSWKGRANREVVVFTRGCAINFYVGERYLVLAYVPGNKHDLYTDWCMQSALSRHATAQLTWLGNSKRL